MIWIILSATTVGLGSLYLGYQKVLYLDQVTKRNVSITLLAAMVVFLFLQLLQSAGYFPQEAGAATMTAVYASLSGFFLGAALFQFRQKSEAGEVLYVQRSFWTDIFPNLVALALILFGLQRTALLSDLPITPIRFTSGLSIIAIGLWGYTIRLIPEFRDSGIILLDRLISWDALFTYSWFAEEIIEIEYMQDEHIRSFKTMIPSDDHLKVEKLLSAKMTEKIEKESFEDYEEIKDD